MTSHDQSIAQAAREYVRAHQASPHPGMSWAVRDAHQALIAAVHAEPTFPDQTCDACGLEHPGAPCPQPSLMEDQ